MGSTTPVIRSVTTPTYLWVSIDASDGNRYDADLSSFAGVYCFPRSSEEWSQVSIDSYALGLVWASRFEVHVSTRSLDSQRTSSQSGRRSRRKAPRRSRDRAERAQTSGRIVSGKIVVEGKPLPEGATVTVVALDDSEAYELEPVPLGRPR